MKITLKEVREDAPRAEALEHMRTHVYLNIGVTDRHPDDTYYIRAGHRLFTDRETWYSGTDEERAEAISEAVNSVARNMRERPE